MKKLGKLFHLTLHKKLFILSLVLSVLVTITFSMVSKENITNALIDDHAKYELNRFNQADQYIKSMFSITEDYLQQIFENEDIYKITTERNNSSSLFEIQQQMTIMDRELNHLLVQRNYIDHILFIGENEFNYAYTWGSRGQYLGPNLAHDEFVISISALNPDYQEGLPFYYNQSHPANATEDILYGFTHNKILYTRSIRDQQRGMKGLIVVVLNTDFVTDLFSDTYQGQNIGFYDKNGTVIWSQGSTDLPVVAEDYRRTYYSVTQLHDTDYLTVSQKIHPYQFILVNHLPIQSFLDIKKDIPTHHPLFLLVYYLLLSSLTYWLALKVSQPLKNLTSTLSDDLGDTLSQLTDVPLSSALSEATGHLPKKAGKKRKRMRIKNSLILYFLLATMLPNSLFMLLATNYYHHYYKDQTISLTHKTIELVKNSVDHRLSQYDNMTQQICYSPSLQGFYHRTTPYQSSDNLDIIDNYFNQIRKLQPDILALNLYDTANVNIYSSNYYAPYSYHLPDKGQELLDDDSKGKLELIHVSEDYSTSPLLTFGRTIRSNHKHNFSTIVGYALFDINQSIIDTIYQQVLNYDNADLFMIDSTGRIINYDKENRMMRSLMVQPDFQQAIKKPKGHMTFDYNNNTYLIIYNTTELLDFKIVSVIPYQTIEATLKPVLKYTFFDMIICFLAIVALSSIMALNISKRLYLLQSAMGHTEHIDQLCHKLDLKSEDEIGQLSRQFQHLVLRLNELIKENYRAKIREQELLVLEKEAQLNALQQQINPHFLYNTLESIKWMAYGKGNMDICKMINALGNFFRGSIVKSNNLISFSEEIDHLENYLYIQRLRYSDKLQISCHIDEAIYQCFTIKLLLQPLVENAINHGTDSLESGGIIQITGTLQDNRVIICIQDNGVGISPERLYELREHLQHGTKKDLNSVGLKNVYQRLKYNFGDKGDLIIESQLHQGTSVKVILPITY